jgi:hypothetical protein
MVRFAGSFELFLADFGALTPIAFVMVGGLLNSGGSPDGSCAVDGDQAAWRLR